MTAKRPYREALEWEQVRQILEKDSGTAFDPDCVAALQCWYEKHELASRAESQMEAVERLVAEL
ncbi:MAG: hypothetical protein WCO86_10935 [Planctomycetota bacterium]